jgi:AbrB family looped-hinge helix DNA binding protein
MHDKKLFGTATVGTKGQVVIPVEAREELGIETGERMYVLGSPKSSVVILIKEEKMEAFIDHLSFNIQNFKKYRSVKNDKE